MSAKGLLQCAEVRDSLNGKNGYFAIYVCRSDLEAGKDGGDGPEARRPVIAGASEHGDLAALDPRGRPVAVDFIHKSISRLRDAIAMRFTYCLAPISLALPHIRDGTVVALGESTARRSTLLPEVPTIAEAKAAGFNFPIWYGIWVPAGAPTGVVYKLANDIGRVLAGPDLRKLIAKHAGEPLSMTQPQFVRFVESESEGATHESRQCHALIADRLMSCLRNSRNEG